MLRFGDPHLSATGGVGTIEDSSLVRRMMRKSLLHSAEPHLIGRVCTLLPQIQNSSLVSSAAIIRRRYRSALNTCVLSETIQAFNQGASVFLARLTFP